MQTRPLGNTGLSLPILGFGASSLGQEFRNVTVEEALRSVRVALDCGLNLIDTSPFYGRGMSEVLLGVALKGVPREQYTLCTKLGRYDLQHFDFSARRVAESIDVSLHRLGTDHLDILLCHDIEFVPMQQIVDETLPAIRKAVATGKVRFVGFSGYPQKIFRFIADQAPVDCVLSYNQYTLPEGPRDRRHECRTLQRTPAHQRFLACLAQGARGGEGRCPCRGRALRPTRIRHRQAGPAVLLLASRHRHHHRRQRQPGEHPQLGALD
jgi:aryl-alcohol dehydrogenase-like predicted oxidoreductase